MNTKIHNVLIGTSLSPASDDVVRAGLAVARAAGAKVHIVHASCSPTGFGADWFTRRNQIREQADRLGIDRYKLASALLERGPAHRVILDTAKAAQADLIVIGAGEPAGRSLLAGCTADRVAQEAKCPVLVVRGELAQPLRQLLLPVDLSPLAAKTLRDGLSIVELVGVDEEVSLEALFAVTAVERQRLRRRSCPSEAESEVANRLTLYLAGQAATSTWNVAATTVHRYSEQLILERAADIGADLIVLGTHGRGGFERLLLGNVASGVVRRGSSSVLVIPPEGIEEIPVAA
jgi:nucleotide-binding universal stress UspA family protein